MNKLLLTYFSIVVGFGLMLATPAWADFQAGMDAYYRGDFETALKEFRPLAEQGDPLPQSYLGSMYYEGLWGAPQDYVLAHMWMNLAAAKGVKRAVKACDLLEKHMTPAQLAEGQRLAREWRPKGRE